MTTKTLSDVKQDMSNLYERLLHGELELQTAKQLNATTSNFLKAEQLELARDIFTGRSSKTLEYRK